MGVFYLLFLLLLHELASCNSLEKSVCSVAFGSKARRKRVADQRKTVGIGSKSRRNWVDQRQSN